MTVDAFWYLPMYVTYTKTLAYVHEHVHFIVIVEPWHNVSK